MARANGGQRRGGDGVGGGGGVIRPPPQRLIVVPSPPLNIHPTSSDMTVELTESDEELLSGDDDNTTPEHPQFHKVRRDRPVGSGSGRR